MLRTRMLRRLLGAATLPVAAAVAGCNQIFSTDVTNPNAVTEDAVNSDAAASIAAGAGGVVTRMLSSVYAPATAVSDEMTHIGSRDDYRRLIIGDVSWSYNEFTAGAYLFVAEARWTADYAITRLEEFVKTPGVDNLTLARAYLYGAITYLTIVELYDDFVISSDRQEAGTPVGPENMVRLYDTVLDYITKGEAIATQRSNAGLRQQFALLRARTFHSRAVWRTLKPGRTRPANPLINDADANRAAAAALALVPNDFYFRLTPLIQTLPPTVPIFGDDLNQRRELQPAPELINATLDANGNPIRMPYPLTARLQDPISRAVDPVMVENIRFYHNSVATDPRLVPVTISSTREMQLILAEAALARGDTLAGGEFATRINAVRTLNTLPAWAPGAGVGARDILIHMRRVNLYLTTRRLLDMYRFGIVSPRWTANSTAARRPGCVFSIGWQEIQTNPNLSDRPVVGNPSYCPAT